MTGPGVEHGVLSTFKSVFEVDATDAGPGDLKVRVGGRRGNSSLMDIFLILLAQMNTWLK